jgi:hypothetical protein
VWLLLFFDALMVSARQAPPVTTNTPARESAVAPQPQGYKPAESSMAVLTNSQLRMVEPGIFEIGKVRLDQRRRSVSFPAMLDKSQGLMEYFLVTTYGKTHESILKTEALPYHIHLAMLLLGAAGTGSVDFPGSPTNGVPGPVVHPSKETMPGNKATISVKWKTPAGETERSPQDLIYKNDTRGVMEEGRWVYNGSLIVQNKFLAQMDGSIISLVTDPVALINYTGPGHDNDLIWEPNATNLPAADVPVEVTITIPETAGKP